MEVKSKILSLVFTGGAYKFLTLLPILWRGSQTGESGEGQQLVLHSSCSCVHMLFDVNVCPCFSEVD